MKKLIWKYDSGSEIQAPLSFSGPYVISHRPNQFTCSYRPLQTHKHVGMFKTLKEAKEAAENHFFNLKCFK